MTQIVVLPHSEYCPEGAVLEVTPGTSVCEALLENHIPIEHACDMVCACTTCHVIVKEGYQSLNEPDENEEDLLDRAWGLNPQSRLSCQAIVARQDLVIEIPKYSINHAKENHWLLAWHYTPDFKLTAINFLFILRFISIDFFSNHPKGWFFF